MSGPLSDQLSVLTIDDPHIAALSPSELALTLIDRLNVKLKLFEDSQRLKLCQVFDLVIGSGLGGVLATLIGSPFELEGEDLRNTFIDIVEIVFPLREKSTSTKAKELEKFFKALIKSRLPDHDEESLFCFQAYPKCRVIVIANAALDLQSQRPVAFTNWYSFGTTHAKIWEVLRAATAYPGLVDNINIRGEIFTGTTYANGNPTMHVVNYEDKARLRLVVSLGAGHPATIAIPSVENSHQVARALQALCTDREAVNESAEQYFSQPPAVPFFRLSVPQGHQGLETEKVLSKVSSAVFAHTRTYISRTRTGNDLKEIIEHLLGRSGPLALQASTLVTTTKIPRRILSLDGGGLTPLCQLLMLEVILDHIAPNTKPCEYFHLIGGSGFGGVIAILLGRLELGIADALYAFQELVKDLWTSANMTTSQRTADFQHRITSLLRAKLKTPSSSLASSNNCKTLVLANTPSSLNSKIPVVFSSYPRRNSVANGDITINKAIHATVSHPDFLEEATIEEGPLLKTRFFGTDFANGNPTASVLEEFRTLWPGDHLACIISLGAGDPGVKEYDTSTPTALVDLFKSLCADNENHHENHSANFGADKRSGLLAKDPYFRFNVEQGMQDMNRWDEDQLRELRAHVGKYFTTFKTRRELTRLAEQCKKN